MVDLDMQAPRLVGRASELGVLDDFVRGSVSGGGALLLTGDPGVGKSALLDAAVRAAAAHGTRVIRGGGVEYQADVGFAVLHQLLGPLGDHVEELPASRRSALQVALGLASGPAPDRLSVLDAALATFRRAAAAAPLLVVVDDMHWLDEATASVVGFVGRRPADSRVGLLGGPGPGRVASPAGRAGASWSSRHWGTRRRWTCSAPASPTSPPGYAETWWRRRRATHWRCSSSPRPRDRD